MTVQSFKEFLVGKDPIIAAPNEILHRDPHTGKYSTRPLSAIDDFKPAPMRPEAYMVVNQRLGIVLSRYTRA